MESVFVYFNFIAQFKVHKKCPIQTKVNTVRYSFIILNFKKNGFTIFVRALKILF